MKSVRKSDPHENHRHPCGWSTPFLILMALYGGLNLLGKLLG